MQHELDAVEQENILTARIWAFQPRKKNILSAQFAQTLHRKMFNKVWRWAGHYRQSNKNIGCEWHQVPIQLMNLCDDGAYWVANNTYPWDELAARFHHQLVLIHPFPNGNGRHARLLTDLLMHLNGQAPFSWGSSELKQPDKVRETYILALRAADRGNCKPLVAFVRASGTTT
jgi:Fic-DOC domain mobile mystery protein B